MNNIKTSNSDSADLREYVHSHSRLRMHYLTQARDMSFVPQGAGARSRLGLAIKMADSLEHVIFDSSPFAREQIKKICGVPSGYFDQLEKENPALLADCLNNGMNNLRKKDSGLQHLLRTHEGRVESMLPNRFLMLSNERVLDLANLLVREFDMEPGSCYADERGNLEINLLSPTSTISVGEAVTAENAKVNDIMRVGLRLSNNEFAGEGSFKMDMLLMRLVCLNGLVVPTYEDSVSVPYRSGIPYPIAADGAVMLPNDNLHVMDAGEVAELGCDAAKKILLESDLTQLHGKIGRAKDTVIRCTNFGSLAAKSSSMAGLELGPDNLGMAAQMIREDALDGELSVWQLLNVYTSMARGMNKSDQGRVEKRAFSFLDMSGDRIETLRSAALAPVGTDDEFDFGDAEEKTPVH